MCVVTTVVLCGSREPLRTLDRDRFWDQLVQQLAVFSESGISMATRILDKFGS